jgi:hypothetical protein
VAGASHRWVDYALPPIAVQAASSGGERGGAEQDGEWPAHPIVTSTADHRTSRSRLPRPAARGAGRNNEVASANRPFASMLQPAGWRERGNRFWGGWRDRLCWYIVSRNRPLI